MRAKFYLNFTKFCAYFNTSCKIFLDKTKHQTGLLAPPMHFLVAYHTRDTILVHYILHSLSMRLINIRMMKYHVRSICI